MTPEKDPWADLAESLGAAPSSEPQPQRSVPPSRPQPPPPTSRPRPRASGSDWEELASDLGIESGRPTAGEPSPPTRESTPPRRSMERRPPREVQTDSRREAQPPANWADNVLDTADRQAERPTRDREESGESREGGERRGRRRRGRRGGRGRRGEARADDRPAGDRDDRRRSPEAVADEFDRPIGASDASRAGTVAHEDGSEGAEAQRTVPGTAAEGDGERTGRRRRRGRRGGRRRGRSTRDRLAGERMAAEQPESEQRLDDLDDEPLATGYGATPRPASANRAEPERPASGEEGERRGRRRRRRGSGDSRSTASRQEPTREAGRRRRGESSRSGSRSDRGRRRDDFTPVAGRFEEDDEGLEFLGVEEAGRTPQAGRDRRPSAEDDSIADSGLDTVREVPSWVEAIGIVIASNLDARSKSGGRK